MLYKILLSIIHPNLFSPVLCVVMDCLVLSVVMNGFVYIRFTLCFVYSVMMHCLIRDVVPIWL